FAISSMSMFGKTKAADKIDAPTIAPIVTWTHDIGLFNDMTPLPFAIFGMVEADTPPPPSISFYPAATGSTT
mgnify:CR=1